MRVGVALDPAADPGDVAEEARLIEDLGYDLVAAGEHVFFHGPVSNAFLLLSAAASVTDRVRLLSSLTILPLYPVVLATKMAATLDRISHGRFDLGIGVGGEYPPEFAASGVDVTERGRNTDVALDLLVRLLSGERVSAEGHFGSLDDLVLDPPPLQQPHPPIWVGGRARPAMRRAGRFADVWMPYMVSPDSFASSLETARAFATDAGRSADALSGALFVWGSVDDDAERARSETVAKVSTVYDQDFEPLADRYLLHGAPDQVAERVQEYAAAGVETLVLSPACPLERRREVITQFAEWVLPLLDGSGAQIA